MSSSAADGTPRSRGIALSLLSASVLLLQLVQTRLFSVMLWHHLTDLVVTFTLLGFAAGGAILACRRTWLQGDPGARLARLSLLFAAGVVAAYAIVTRVAPGAQHTRAGIATAALVAALSDMVATYGEEPVAVMCAKLPDRIRGGEFSIAQTKQ